MRDQFPCEECGLVYPTKMNAEVCASTDQQLSRQAHLGLASSRFLEWSREGRELLDKIDKRKNPGD